MLENPKRFIYGIDPIGTKFMELGVKPLAQLINDDVSFMFCHAIYQEVCQQIFAVMSSDFNQFSESLRNLPDFKRLIRHEIILLNEPTIHHLRAHVLEFGIGIWFLLRDQGYFSLPNETILDHPDIGYVIVMAAD